MWELLSKLLVTIDYYRDGKLVYTSDSIVASVFALTGSKPGAFSVNVDTRYTHSFADELINVIKNNAIPTCWLMRKVLEEETSWAAAVKRLKTERISASVYYIVAGLGGN